METYYTKPSLNKHEKRKERVINQAEYNHTIPVSADMVLILRNPLASAACQKENRKSADKFYVICDSLADVVCKCQFVSFAFILF